MAWLARWIANPHAIRPTATMPRLLPEPSAKSDPAAGHPGWDIAAYLSSIASRVRETGRDGPVPTTAEPFRPGWFEAAPPERRVRLENHVRLWASLAAERLGQGEAGGRASL